MIVTHCSENLQPDFKPKFQVNTLNIEFLEIYKKNLIQKLALFQRSYTHSSLPFSSAQLVLAQRIRLWIVSEFLTDIFTEKKF